MLFTISGHINSLLNPYLSHLLCPFAFKRFVNANQAKVAKIREDMRGVA